MKRTIRLKDNISLVSLPLFCMVMFALTIGCDEENPEKTNGGNPEDTDVNTGTVAETDTDTDTPLPIDAQSEPLITEAEGDALLAFASISESTLYVTDPERLQAALVEGFWPALNWQPEQEVALLALEGGDEIELFVELIEWIMLLNRNPEPGDHRFLEEFRRKWELSERVWECEARTDTYNGRQSLSFRYARSRQVSLVEQGDVMAPEVYSDSVRNYLYATTDCREYLGHTSHVADWIIERSPWPNP